MRIIQLTDCHIYGDAASNFDGINTKKTFERVLEGVQKVKKPDLVVGTGDLSMDGSPQSYSWLRQRLERIDAPVILIPGNHDQQDELENRIGSKCFLKCSSLVIDPWCFHFLNTAHAGSHAGRILNNDLSTLTSNLGKNRETFNVIFMHHPPVKVGSIWLDDIGLINATEFWHSIEDASVKLIVCGHIHQELDIVRKNVRVLTSPSTCLQFKPLTKEYSADSLAPGFRMIDFSPDGSITTDVIRTPI
jgi:Icc protein